MNTDPPTSEKVDNLRLSGKNLTIAGVKIAAISAELRMGWSPDDENKYTERTAKDASR